MSGYVGPGSPSYRLKGLLNELARRFPGVHNPIMSDPPEPKYLIAIDTKVAMLEEVAKWAKRLEESLRRCDRDGVPQIDAWALSSLRAAIIAKEKAVWKEGK